MASLMILCTTSAATKSTMATTSRGTAPACEDLSTCAWMLDRLTLRIDWSTELASACMSGILHHGRAHRGEPRTWQSSASGRPGPANHADHEERVRAAVV